MGINPTTSQELRQRVSIMTKLDLSLLSSLKHFHVGCGFFFTNIYLTQRQIGFVNKPVSSLNKIVYAV
jgi:hypothetical protein